VIQLFQSRFVSIFSICAILVKSKRESYYYIRKQPFFFLILCCYSKYSTRESLLNTMNCSEFTWSLRKRPFENPHRQQKEVCINLFSSLIQHLQKKKPACPLIFADDQTSHSLSGTRKRKIELAKWSFQGFPKNRRF